MRRALAFAAMLVVLTMLAMSLVGVVAQPEQVLAEPTPSDGVAPTEAEAVAEAHRSNRPAQVSSLLSAQSEVRALPSGELEQTIHAVPQRVFKDGEYVPIDTILVPGSNSGVGLEYWTQHPCDSQSFRWEDLEPWSENS